MTAAVTLSRHPRRPLATLGRTTAALLLLIEGFAAGLSAQSPSLLPSSQARQTQSDILSGVSSGVNAVCTPAEYGDPTADCIPPSRQFGSGMYNVNDFGDFETRPDMRGSLMPNFEDDGNARLSRASADNASKHPVRVQKEPPTEFQRYVADSIGQMLPIFGASLFEEVPATFSPLEHNAVSSEYRIAPGDELQIAVWGQFNFTRRFIVDRTGRILIPDAGPVSVSGMNYSQAADIVKASLSHFYKNFDVSVTLARLHSVQIFVVGDARRPGSYNVSSLSTLVNAIFASGGPSSRGSMRSIELKRGNQTIRQFDLYRLLLHGDKSQDAPLSPGDVILFPSAGARIAVAGSVEHPGIYEITPHTTLKDALGLADGLSPLASLKQVVLERISSSSRLQVRRLSTNSEDLQTELQNGDIIRVVPIVQRFHDTVTLRGNVADPGRFTWREGMRLSDLLPDRESLLTRDYWKEHNTLGASEQLISRVGTSASDQAAQARTTDDQTPVAEQTINGAKTSAAEPFQEEKRDTRGDTSLGASMGLENTPPVRRFNPRYTVQPSAPEIYWDYAAIERTDPITLTTSIIPFNLGKLVLSHDATQNLELRPGDVVTIFSKADFAIPRTQQPVQVRIEGEIRMAGLYNARPGETLRHLVARAGGLTANAYLYGAQFTRESTQREQQKRYDEFLDQLERQMDEQASNLSSRITSPQQAVTAQVSLASQRQMIDRLRKTSLNGRIVLDMEPSSEGVASVPNITLENGDRFYVPARPSTVNVIGDVFEQASFVYDKDYRTVDYLKQAGGPARSADRDHMFVIRADGSVVSRPTSTLFAKNFNSIRMYPGDTLIVPTYINKTSFVRGLLDWSTIVSNFGLGAAAVNVLR